MKRMISAALAVLLCAPLAQTSAQAASDDTVRVGLYYGSSALAQAEFGSDEDFTVGKMRGTRFAKERKLKSGRVTVSAEDGGLVVADADSGKSLYETDEDTLALSPRAETTTLGGNTYRGDFVCRVKGDKVEVVNFVDREDYIKGVVPYEMSASWPIEALKAQAVCARSYTGGLAGKHAGDDFDLCNTTHCEVYRGTGRATENSDAAVDDTAGETLWYDGAPVVGYYFAASGGATEDAKNVWGGDYPYLTGVPDPYEDTENASNGVWSKTLSADEVGAKLRAAGHAIGTVASVEVTKRTAMDNVNELVVTDTSGKQAKLTRSACRTVLGLNSIRYSVTAASGTPRAQTSGTVFVVGADGEVRAVDLNGLTMLTAQGAQPAAPQTAPASEDGAVHGKAFTFSGRGWGHSVGMSQYGAKGMAEAGFDYEDILRHYFIGVDVE